MFNGLTNSLNNSIIVNVRKEKIIMKIYVIAEYNDYYDQRYLLSVLVNPDGKDLEKYQCYGYEIYITLSDGTLECIQESDRYPREYDEDYF